MARAISVAALAAWLALAAGPQAAHAHDGPSQPHAGDLAAWPEPLRRELRDAEALLAQGDARAALQGFERAALGAHEARIELGQLRALMQLGAYRQALGFAAHTAGVHADEAAGRVFYAWLLDLGAQPSLGRRLAQQASGDAAVDPQLLAMQRWWQQADAGQAGAWPPAMLQGEAALGPVATGAPVADAAAAVASAWLLPSGRMALMPAAALPLNCQTDLQLRLWVRNGLGQALAAQVLDRDDSLGLILLKLDGELPVPTPLRWAPQDAQPGSPAYALDHWRTDGQPGWPHLRAGFVGRGGLLGVRLPVPTRRGGPVLDAGGRLIGLAQAGEDGRDKLVAVGALRARFGPAIGPQDELPRAPTVDAEAIYEHGLLTTLQVLRSPQ